MKDNESFILLTILGTVALVGILLMINTAGTNNAGMAYSSNSISIDMVSGDEYNIYGKNLYLEYIDGDTTALKIEGVLLKVPNGEKVTYKGLGIFSYGGEEIDAKKNIYKASIDFYR